MNLTMSSMIAAAAMLAASVGSADALQLRMSVGASSIEVFDNDAANDQDPTANFINYDQSAASTSLMLGGWDVLKVEGGLCTVCDRTVTMSMEATHPGDPGDFLVVELWHYGFITPDPMTWIGVHGPTAIMPDGASITMSAYWDPSDNPYSRFEQMGESFTLDNLTPPQSAPFIVGGEVSRSRHAGAVPYGMTLVYELRVDGQGRTAQAQSEALMEPIPVPAALPLLAGALGLFGVMRARRRPA